MIETRELIKEVVRLAHKFPDRQGECKYVDKGKPSCILGHALHNKGVSVKDLESANEAGILTWFINQERSIYSPTFKIRLSKAGDQFWLARVQFNQDEGMKWLESVTLASKGKVIRS